MKRKRTRISCKSHADGARRRDRERRQRAAQALARIAALHQVERDIRPIELNRRNVLSAGSDGGGKHWAVIASLVETCKLNAVDSHAYLGEGITRIVTGHPQSHIDDLLPWDYTPESLKALA